MSGDLKKGMRTIGGLDSILNTHVLVYILYIHACTCMYGLLVPPLFPLLSPSVMCVRSRPDYFAEQLYKSMKGMGTDDDTLVRLVVTRCEV